MSKYRRAARIDKNQPDIVEALRAKLGVSVELGHDDILVGYRDMTYWYEIKSDRVVGKDGKIKESGIKKDQKRIRDYYMGHYKIVATVEEILADIGYGAIVI